MKPSRVKSIVIVILLLLNLLLLIPFLYRHVQERSAYKRSIHELTELFTANQIALSPAVLPQALPDAAPEFYRDDGQEKAFATALLGPVFSREVGGGIHRFYNGNGSCLIRSNGAVDVSSAAAFDAPEKLCNDLCQQFGYTIAHSELQSGSSTVTLVRTVGGAPIYNATLTLQFRAGESVSVSGSLLTAYTEQTRAGELDAVSALVRFLDYQNSPGAVVVCTAVTGLECGYLLQSTLAEPLRLVPVWCVHTDVSNYYVNCSTGAVTRE